MDTNKPIITKNENINHIKNLIAIAHIDGNFSINERNLIFKVGRNFGLTEYEVNEYMMYPTEAELIIPVSVEKKEIQFHNYIQLIIVDNQVGDEELEFCKIIGNALGFSDEQFHQILNDSYNYAVS